MSHYYRIKFGNGVLDETKVLADKVVEAEHMSSAVELVCQWYCGHCNRVYVGPEH